MTKRFCDICGASAEPEPGLIVTLVDASGAGKTIECVLKVKEGAAYDSSDMCSKCYDQVLTALVRHRGIIQ